MGDIEDDRADLGQHVLRTARVEGLRHRMNAFVDSYEGSLNCEELRSSVDSMADLVEDGRTERI